MQFFPEQTLDIIDKAHFTLLFYNTGMYIFGFIINWKIVIKIERNNLLDIQMNQSSLSSPDLGPWLISFLFSTSSRTWSTEIGVPKVEKSKFQEILQHKYR